MLNQVLEATLVFMILLLAMSIAAIVRVGPTAPATTESNVETEIPMQQPVRVLAGPQPGPSGPPLASGPYGPPMAAGPSGRPLPSGPAGRPMAPGPAGRPMASGQAVAGPPSALWTGPMPGSMRSAAPPPVRRSGWLGRVRYEARHVRGRMPKPRPSAPAGPPWGPAAPPPGRPQQGSERWT
jgi:hypothetical protein